MTDIGLTIDAATPDVLQAESDDPVDDLVVHLSDHSRVYVQAKVSTGMSTGAKSSLPSALSQFAAAVRSGLAADDWLVLATAEPVGAIRALARVLDRSRLAVAGASTNAESEAVSALERVARSAGVTDEELAEIKRHLVVWVTDPRDGDGAMALAARLDGHVALAGKGREAADVLTSTVRALARLRGGRDAMQFATALAGAGVPLQPAAPPSSAVAMARAIGEHRERVVRAGRTLALFGAPPELRDIPLDAADAQILVDIPDEEERSSGRRLELALRRRGRALLVGAPGGGKSTALRAAAAHWAERPAWPTPVHVHLKGVSDGVGSAVDSLLDAAVADRVDPAQRALLRQALAHELAAGRCLILLDGLDEVRRGREALVEDVVSLIDELPAATEVLLATRPVAVDDARPLGLPELRLRAPDRPEVTVEAILQAAKPLESDEGWVEQRRSWVDRALSRDGTLGRTPLTVVVLSLVALKARDLSHLPSTRASVLHRALLDVVEGWEVRVRNRGDVSIGQLTGSRAEHALIEALCALSASALLDESQSEPKVERHVAVALGEAFALPRGDARAAAEDAVAFWTDLGLFAFNDGTLKATVMQMAELGQAWRAAFDGEPPAEDWVAYMRRSPDLWPSLALGAGLAPAIARAWAEAVGRDGNADELVAFVDATADGADAGGPEVLGRLATAVAERLLGVPADAERVAEALLYLPLTQPVRDLIRPVLACGVPDDRRRVVDVLAILRWDERDAAKDEQLREFLLAAPPPRPAGTVPLGSFEWPRPDDAYQSARNGAMLRLAATSREDAELVAAQFNDGSYEFRDRLESAFREAGHEDLAQHLRADLERSFESQRALFRDLDIAGLEQWLYTTIGDLAPPSPLTQIQERRLDELASFAATAQLNWVWPSKLEKRKQALAAWLRSAAELGGFDRGVLAAQARIVLVDLSLDDDTDSLVHDGGTRRNLEHWNGVEDVGGRLDELMLSISGIPQQAGAALMFAIASCPDKRQAIARLEEALPRYRIWAREGIAFTVLVALAEIPDTGVSEADARAKVWLNDADPTLRRASAMWWGYRRRAGEACDEHDRCLADLDAGVVREAVVWLAAEALDDTLRSRLREVRAVRERGWKCIWCDYVNPPGHSGGCGDCSSNGPDVREAVDKLLGERRGRTLPRPAWPRRVRRREILLDPFD